MPWKQVKDPTFHLPTRQEMLIIASSIILALIVLAYFVLKS